MAFVKIRFVVVKSCLVGAEEKVQNFIDLLPCFEVPQRVRNKKLDLQ